MLANSHFLRALRPHSAQLRMIVHLASLALKTDWILEVPQWQIQGVLQVSKCIKTRQPLLCLGFQIPKCFMKPSTPYKDLLIACYEITKYNYILVCMPLYVQCALVRMYYPHALW